MGALIAFERGDRGVRRLVELAVERAVPLHVPAAVVGQVWRDGSRQVRLARLVGSGHLHVRTLDLGEAKAAGVLCGLARTTDVVDASVVVLARRHHATVVTSDSADIRRLDTTVSLVRC